MTSLLDGLHFCTGDERARALALGRSRPVPVAPDEQDGHSDAAVVFCCGFPTRSVAEQTDEGAVVPSAIAHGIHLLHERRRDALGVRDAASKDRLHDDEIPEPVHRLANYGNERCVRDEPTEQ